MTSPEKHVRVISLSSFIEDRSVNLDLAGIGLKFARAESNWLHQPISPDAWMYVKLHPNSEAALAVIPHSKLEYAKHCMLVQLSEGSDEQVT